MTELEELNELFVKADLAGDTENAQYFLDEIDRIEKVQVDTNYDGRPMQFMDAMPDQGVLDTIGTRFKIAGQEMFSTGDVRLMNVLKEEFPGAVFSEDAEGNLVADFTADGGQVGIINHAGLDKRDINKTLMAVAQFSPASRMLGAGKTLLSSALRVGGSSAVIETARDGSSQALGGTEDTSFKNLDGWNIGLAVGTGFASPYFGRIVENVIKRLVPSARGMKVQNDDGSITDEALELIQKNNEVGSVVNQELKTAMQNKDVLPVEQLERFNLFKSQNVLPTKANVAQTADDFRFQQEKLKESGPIREAVDLQDSQLAQRMNDLAESTGSLADDSYAAGENVFNAVTKRALDEDAAVSAVYKSINESLGAEKIIKFSRTALKLKEMAGRNELSGGMVKAIKSELQNRGVLDESLRPVGRINAATAEEVRKVMNSFHEGANGQGRQLLKQIKDAFDDDVTASAGADFFKAARAAKTQFHVNLAKAKKSKFDKGSKNLVEDILAGKIKADDIFSRVVTNKGYGVDDVAMLRNYLTSGTEEQIKVGNAAWSDLRRQTLEHMLSKATGTAGKVEGGGSVFNGTQFAKAMDQIGSKKLTQLFPDMMKDLTALRKISGLRIPMQSVQSGEGPTSFAVKKALDASVPEPIKNVFKGIFRSFKDGKVEKIAVDPVKETLEAVERASGINLTAPLSGVLQATGLEGFGGG